MIILHIVLLTFTYLVIVPKLCETFLKFPKPNQLFIIQIIVSFASLANQSKRPIADVDEISKWVEILIVVGFPRLVLPLAQLVLHLQETVRAEPVGRAIFQLSLQKEKN